ncbi:MAG: fibronectin type III domain-containing protein [Eubacterium sp.]|nr:fibronectin type III domain-containing protein [Eubacterium sp.]
MNGKDVLKRNGRCWNVGFKSVLTFAVVLLFGSGVSAQAKTITIKSPEDLRDINWANKGFGPGNTYVIGNDMTLGDGEYATCRLTRGKFVIDFNGHTVQNANNKLGTFSISGADVTLKDSKVSSSKPSVRSYGAGAIDMTGGKLTIYSGNYLGVSNGTNNPTALHVGGGTCVVNGGFFYGDTIGSDCSQGTMYVNGGTFQTGYMFALGDLGNGKIKISKANFISGTTTYGYHFAIGGYAPNAQTYDFNRWLASGSSFSTQFQTGYWNMQSSVLAYPYAYNFYAVAYETPKLAVTSTVKKPGATRIKKIKSKSKKLKVSWKKQSGISGYQLQIATNKKFTKNRKQENVKATASAKTFKKLKAKKKYYVRIRTYRNFNGTTLYSNWSSTKAKKTK